MLEARRDVTRLCLTPEVPRVRLLNARNIRNRRTTAIVYVAYARFNIKDLVDVLHRGVGWLTEGAQAFVLSGVH